MYKFRDEVHDCDCQTQYDLRKHYLLANIPAQYQRLHFSEYRDEGVKQAVQNYIDGWEHAAKLGLGLLFHSEKLGTGKTFAATHVGKELIKRKQKVYFVPFEEVINKRELSDSLMVTAYLIVDEVRKPYTERAATVFADNFERVIRHRNHHALPTVLTTNLTLEDMDEHYPRVASLLVPNTVEIRLPGDSYRTNSYAMENLALLANKEVRPIT